MRTLIWSFSLLLFVGCSDPMSVIIPLGKDVGGEEFTDAVKSLPEADRKMVGMYMVRVGMQSALSNTPLPTVTIGEALEEQRKFEAEQKVKEEAAKEAEAKREAEEAEMRRQAEETVEAMRAVADVFLISKEFTPSNYRAGIYQDYLSISCGIHNKSDVDINGIKGKLIINNTFGDLIFEITITIEEQIKAGEKKQWDGSMEYNQFIDEHRALRNAEIEKIKTIWVPESYIFDDGSTL